ncbi:putative Ig domain-containing protein [Occallatibacter riparius]|uniref:Ig domain-containing protein n=1 Tax=Occallatibacter riparius TaxID=1002689 RepID=A0A9J7BUC2_9BACT|nr:putative Ig domain-containing protein [Occallatibacter riparius]UWZ84526.1 putative Ig domain-containing protein [Occallatibacter riparius]
MVSKGCFRSPARQFFDQASFISPGALATAGFALLALLVIIAGCGGGSSTAPPPPPSAPSNLVYPHTAISATVGAAITPDTPTVTGTVSSYSVSPTLPAGLAISASTGAISGTPTATSAQTTYTVTASNSSGSTTASISIAVLIPAPSNLVYPQTAISGTVGTAITPDTPTVTGTVSSYSISPTLPAGLAISASTGAISGTPTAASPKTSYTVTASNSTGSATATLSITVLIPAPSKLVYSQTDITAFVGAAITPDTPTVTGTASSYSISPALPAGLTINSSSGVISGTPTVLSSKASYTVTASNSTGSTTATLSIVVGSPAHSILTAGHQGGVTAIHVTTDRVLTDDGAMWILWNYGTGEVVAAGQRQFDPGPGMFVFQSDMAGEVAVVQTSDKPMNGVLSVYSASTGQLIASINIGGATWVKLATDGSYICSGSTTGLTVWSSTGSEEFTLPGNYTLANVSAMPGRLQVALGPAGQNVIETDSVPSGASTVSAPFNGTFTSWFLDGQRFLTNLGATVWVYSNAVVQQSLMNLPSPYDPLTQQLIGQGNWISITNGVSTTVTGLSVYAIGNATPVATYSFGYSSIIPMGSYLAALEYGPPEMKLIDLSGASPSATDYTLPDQMLYLTSFGANPNGQWIVAGGWGLLLDGASIATTPRYFGYGQITSIAGSSSHIAVATSIGKILLFNSAGDTQQGAIDFWSGNVQLSSDGSVLAASAFAFGNQYYTDRTLNLYSLPSQSIIQTFPYTFNSNNTPFLVGYSLSGSGQTLGQVLGPITPSRQVTPSSGSPIIWSDTGTQGPIVLSPDGPNFAAASGSYPGIVTSDYTAAPSATLWSNDTLQGAIPAFPEGWIDDTHLLAANYMPTGNSYFTYTGSSIYDPAGNVLSVIPGGTSFPPMRNPYFTSNGLVYDAGTNAIYSLATGAKVWTAPPVNGPDFTTAVGAVAGSNVVYVKGYQVFVAPY